MKSNKQVCDLANQIVKYCEPSHVLEFLFPRFGLESSGNWILPSRRYLTPKKSPKYVIVPGYLKDRVRTRIIYLCALQLRIRED